MSTPSHQTRTVARSVLLLAVLVIGGALLGSKVIESGLGVLLGAFTGMVLWAFLHRE